MSYIFVEQFSLVLFTDPKLPAGCFYSNALGGLKCYENPKNKVTAVPANEEEICGATFKVKKWIMLYRIGELGAEG